MSDLVTWLRAQLDEDERAARTALLGLWGDALLRAGPEQDLRLIAAHRRILDTYVEAEKYYDAHRSAPAGEAHGLRTAVQHLASAYADRPGYDEAWRRP